MKLCYTCKTEKNEREFNKNKSRKDGLNSICRECSKERSRKYYADNKEKHKKITIERKNRVLKLVKGKYLEYLKQNPCKDCGESDPLVLEPDHLSDKEYNISRMINLGFTWEKVLIELAKCEIVCLNCHRRRTFGRLENCYRFG